MVKVCCAIIERLDFVLVAQRGKNMAHQDKWEFPGGKIEPLETNEQCILREIKEEFDVEIEVIHQLGECFYTFPHPFEKVLLYPFICKEIKQKKYILTQHNQIKWIRKDNLKDLDWTAPDVEVVNKYLRFREYYNG